MPFIDHTGIATQIPDKNQGDLSSPLPFSEKFRNRLVFVLFLALSLWCWHSLSALYQLSQTQEHYSHLVLIPWVSAYVLYLQRQSIVASKEWCPWAGAALIGAGLGWNWYLGGDGTDSNALTMPALAWVVACWGVFLLGYGTHAIRTNAFGLLFLLFTVPLPEPLLNEIIVFLQRNSAEATALFFSVLGVPVFRDGFVFSLSNFTIHVAEECSGIRSTLSLVITSLLAGHFFLRSVVGKMGIAAIVVPLAILKNAFRIVGLALLANYVDPAYITDSVLHRRGGIPLFVLSLIVLALLVWLVRHAEQRLGYGSPNGLQTKA